MKYITLSLILCMIFSCSSIPDKEPENLKEPEILVDENPTLYILADKLRTVNDPQERIPILLDYANELFLAKEYEKSIEAATQVVQLKQDKKSAIAYFLIGQSQYILKSYPEALQSLQMAKTLDKEYKKKDRETMIAKIHFQSKDFGKGLRSLGEASKDKNFQEDQEFYEMAAFGFKEIKLCKRSLKYIEEGLKKYPESSLLRQVESDCK
jgi:tetratricopeptide (TPR) repeat protein